MKKMINIAVVVIFLITGFHVNATDRIDVKIQENHTLLVEVGKTEQEAFLVLEDENGEILFKDRFINHEYYKMKVNLSIMPMGIYYLRLDKEYAILTSTIVKTEEGLHIKGGTSEIAFKPRYKVEDHRVLVQLTNPSETRTKLRVYPAGGEMIGECEGGKSLFKKTLDFSHMPAGEYVIRIVSGDKNYTKKVQIG